MSGCERVKITAVVTVELEGGHGLGSGHLHSFVMGKYRIVSAFRVSVCDDALYIVPFGRVVGFFEKHRNRYI